MKIICRYTKPDSAEVYDIQVIFGRQHLSFDFGLEQTIWENNDILVEEFGSDQLTLTYQDEIIYVEKESWPLIKEDFPQYREGIKLPWYAYALTIVSIIAIYYLSVPGISKVIARNIPNSAKRTIGDTFVKSVKYKNGCDYDYQKRVIKEKVTELTGKDNPYRVIIIESMESNAFAIPGDVIAFTSKALEEFDNEEQLMGVLAHEIAHHKQQHHIQKIIKVSLTSAIWNVTVSSMTGFFALDPEIIKSIAMQSYSKEDEKNADLEAIKLLESKGLSARGLIEYLRNSPRVFGLNNKYFERLLSTHPATEDRINYIRETMSIKNQLARTTFDWVKFKTECMNSK